ncbi:MAG: MotA/TolQ/ExbB proton channel family protein [Bacteroidales bacterium]|nr:MotA/TolQ/ExbB proton channel family protein [Bacteroidales bacterium]
MKKLFAFVAVLVMLSFGASINALAQDEPVDTTAVEQVADSAAVDTVVTAIEEPVAIESDEAEVEAEVTGELHKKIKAKFIEGGASFMGALLLCLIFGLALAIERIIYLNLATTNTEKLLGKVESALESGGIDAAKDVCRDTRGPVASIFYQGLDRADEGVEAAEKSLVSYGSVQMGLLEKNLSWISLFIAIAPMLGFMGTVIGMIAAFDQIRMAGNVSAQLVAGGIQIALITTVTGLIIAVILQIFYNYILSKIDNLVNSMEDSSITLIDMLIKHNLKK